MYETFKEFCLLEPTIKKQTHSAGLCKDRTYQTVAFKTASAPLFKFYATPFNCNSQPVKILRKKAPSEINRWLTPIGLSYWYIDDGSMIRRIIVRGKGILVD